MPGTSSVSRWGGEDQSSVAEAVIPNRLYRLGGFVDLDGRVSWAPPIPGEHQPMNCYVTMERSGENFLIDTGVAGHRSQVVEQITNLLPRGRRLTCFLTRTEYQCVGNLGAVYKARGLDELVSGGRNPFAAYEDVAKDLKDSVRRTVLDIIGGRVPLGASNDLIVLPPLIRVLNTNWVYDKANKTLFSSDWFSHTSVKTAVTSAIIEDVDADPTTYESAVEHMMCRYFWLPQATTQPLSRWLESVFTDCDIDVIAPTFGCVLKGRAIVHKHYEIVMDALRRIGR